MGFCLLVEYRRLAPKTGSAKKYSGRSKEYSKLFFGESNENIEGKRLRRVGMLNQVTLSRGNLFGKSVSLL